MRVFRRRRGARRHSADGTPGIAGLPRAARALLGALPGVAAVVALFLCAHGVENGAVSGSRAAPPRSPATASTLLRGLRVAAEADQHHAHRAGTEK